MKWFVGVGQGYYPDLTVFEAGKEADAYKKARDEYGESPDLFIVPYERVVRVRGIEQYELGGEDYEW